MRITGSGTLKSYLRSLDDVHNIQLPNITMTSTTNREPTILANFNDQRAQLELKITGFDDIFTISKIIIYIRPVATGYPT